MSAVKQTIEIDVPIEDFYKVVTDYARYSEFLSAMRETKVGEPNALGEREVTYTIEVDVGITKKRVSYTLRQREKAPTHVEWNLVRGEIMKSNDGGWALEAIGPNRTKATYTLDVGFGLLVPKAIANLLSEKTLPRTLQEFKTRAEALAKA
ncbi:MAG: SRPBCC family protein [Myxococcales bacterium]|jgi:ribosome-associated toxin RatA of RatAB toxin-antitoxin module|nr:SRPBCC family protein [Myxococcales bacterium]